MEQMLYTYLDLFKILILKRMEYIRENGSKQEFEKAKKNIKDYEEQHKDKLKKYFIYHFYHTSEEYELYLTLLGLFAELDVDFKEKIKSYFSEFFKIDIRDFVNLFFSGKEKIEITIKLMSNAKIYNILKGSRFSPISVSKKIKKKLLHITNDFMDYDFVNIEQSNVELKNVVLTANQKYQITKIIKQFSHLKEINETGGFKKEIKGTVPVVMFQGFPGTGKTMAAHAIAHELNLPIITFKKISLLFDNSDVLGHVNFVEIIKELNQIKGVILIDDFENIVDTHLDLMQLLEALELNRNIIIFTSNTLTPNVSLMPLFRRITYKIQFLLPNKKLRKKLWEFHLPKEFSFADDVNLDEISSFFVLSGGNIKNIMVNYILFNGNEKVIEEKKLVSLIEKEIEKTNFQSAGIEIIHGYGKKINMKYKEPLHTITKIIKLGPEIKMKKGRLGNYLIGNIREDKSFLESLSVLIKKPIFVYNIESEFRRYTRHDEDALLLRDVFLKSASPDDYKLILSFKLSRGMYDKETKTIELFDFEMYQMLENLKGMNEVFFYTTYKSSYDMAVPFFDYSVYITGMDKLSIHPLLNEVQFQEGVNIQEILKKSFPLEKDKVLQLGFIEHLYLEYHLNDKKPISYNVVRQILKKIRHTTQQLPLFGAKKLA